MAKDNTTPKAAEQAGAPTFIDFKVSPEELALLKKMRNKRTIMYNLRVSKEELARLESLEAAIKTAGTELESRPDFIMHLVELTEKVLAGQTKLL